MDTAGFANAGDLEREGSIALLHPADCWTDAPGSMVYSEPRSNLLNPIVLSAYISVKLIHLAAIVVWSAGMLYLPGLFARHPATAGKDREFKRLRHQTRLVYVGLMSPFAVIAVVSGTVLVFLAASLGGWMILKLIAVTVMVLLHTYLGRLMGLLYENPKFRSPRAHRLLLLPVASVIVGVIALVSWKPV